MINLLPFAFNILGKEIDLGTYALAILIFAGIVCGGAFGIGFLIALKNKKDE